MIDSLMVRRVDPCLVKVISDEVCPSASNRYTHEATERENCFCFFQSPECER